MMEMKNKKNKIKNKQKKYNKTQKKNVCMELYERNV